jgi:hypothetical protein
VKHRSIFAPKSILIALAFLMSTAFLLPLGYGQQPSATKAKPQPRPKTGSTQSFVCPDPEAKKACESYQELKKAKDPSLENDFYGISFVCFRPAVDQFFLLSFRQPPPPVRHWDKDLEKMAISDTASARGGGDVTTYDKGIVAGSIVPNFRFLGTWTYLELDKVETFFNSVTTVKTQDDYGIHHTVRIDESRIDIIASYINPQGKLVDYALAIQRSTGRFSEKFHQEDDKIPFIDRDGRCIVQKK